LDQVFGFCENCCSLKEEARGNQVNDYLLASQHTNALTGPAGYLKRRAASMKAIVGESLAWLPVLEQAMNKRQTARRNMTVYCLKYTSIGLFKDKETNEEECNRLT
jgi:hypothetical protein